MNLRDNHMTYKKTGYAYGRPRNGESRPSNPKNERRKERRRERIAEDPGYLAKLAQGYADWRVNNLSRAREIDRNTYKRRTAWEKCGHDFNTPGPFAVVRTDI